ncbi:MAG: helix-turn-helix transcriptional regulator [Okeania sp. SIO2C9]|uniref:helix-turn-helix transcriptional regulator n=1 Tax=Okeania sp. SIO2C9 TaxID=2607791 RepID=UPI0013BF94BF|nr:AraC family transcriptional regulator [Okeania sp. SIO2C9]NEQ78075.1 helix-turn-helix transcriptional regulator [Okeania sp. SIO2C9]
MIKYLTTTEYKAVYQEYLEKGKIVSYSNDFETFLKIQAEEDLGVRYNRTIKLRPGLKIKISGGKAKYTIAREIQHHAAMPLILGFQLSGTYRVWTEGIGDDYYYEKSGENYLFFLPGTKEIEEIPTGVDLQRIRIIVEPDIFRSFSSKLELIPTELKALISNNSRQIFHRNVGAITPAMQQALQQIISCPYQGIARQIYLESKTLELISLQLTQLIQSQSGIISSSSSGCLQPDDIERIHLAKSILEANLENPPSLMELARKVQLNDYKLKRGFKEVFGTTTFGYLQKIRMERGKNLLAEQMLTVARVAQTVGYKSPSRFCDAFKKHFGITPRNYRMSLNL